MQVIVPRAGAADGIPNEAAFRGRFFLVMIDQHLKMVDTETYRLFDLLSEPFFDQESVNGMGFARSLSSRKNRLLLLCHGKDGKSYI